MYLSVAPKPGAMSKIVLNPCNIARRLYHGRSDAPPRRGQIPMARTASKRFAAPQARQDAEARPRIVEYSPSRRFEPFPYAVTEENKLDVLKRVLTPLHDTPYDKQLEAKEAYCRNTLRAIAQDIYRSGTPVRLDARRLPCQVNKIVPSPQIHKYRSTIELTVWYGHDGKTHTVGYNVFPISKHGDTVSVEPNGCQVMTDQSIKLADILQEFVRSQTKVGVSHSLGLEGGWRMFRISTSLNGDLMLTGFINPRTLKVREIIDDRDIFRDFIVKRCQEENLKLVSLYYQPCPKSFCKHEEVPYELLYGEKRLAETIGLHKIMISPDSSGYQTNIGAEIMLDTVRSTLKGCWLQSDQPVQKPFLLDAQSKFGLLSLHLADLARQVIGVENRGMSVEDARMNAQINNVTNCEFINSNLEIVLERIIEKYCVKNRQEMIVVCEVPPSGLHNNVIDVIRQCGFINKIILAAAKISSQRTMQTITNFCLKGQSRSLSPFAPILATPIDLCPLTENFSTVLALERIPTR